LIFIPTTDLLAATYSIVLSEVTASRNGAIGTILGGNLGGTYDDVTNIVTMIPGTFTVLVDPSPLPNNELFTHELTDAVFDIGNETVSMSSFRCIEGTLGPTVLNFICAGTDYGSNGINETTVDYDTIPGTRIIGGDDTDLEFEHLPMEQAAQYTPSFAQFSGTELILETADWNFYGMSMTFTVVPVPPAIWLFGSALGFLGWVKRKQHNRFQ